MSSESDRCEVKDISMDKNENKALSTKIITLTKSCMLFFVVYAHQGLSDEFYVTPNVGLWGYRICQPLNYASTWRPQCEIWLKGTYSDSHCLNKQDPFPWDDESKLVPKALAYPGGKSATFNGWLNEGESLPYNGCYDGPPRYDHGYENYNVASIRLTREDGSTGWAYAERARDVKCPLWAPSCFGVSEKNLGAQCVTNGTPVAGNPITIATGNKYQYEVDIKADRPFGLSLKRYYNSQYSVPGALGYGWRHEYESSLRIDGESINVIRDDGKILPFASVNGQLDVYASDPDVNLSLRAVLDQSGVVEEYHLKTARDEEVYDIEGRLISITDRSGRTKTLVYDMASTAGGDDNSATLDRVISTYGTEIDLKYDTKGRVIEIIHAGSSLKYEYDTNGSLVEVILPDQTPDDDSDNPYKQFHYTQIGGSFFLTGITNENGNRYATWSYDDQGRAISSEHAGGVDKTTLTYNADGTTTVTNPLGKETTYHFTTINGVRKVTQVEGHPTATCAGANKSYQYDANGNIISKTDWNGVTTTYTYNMSRNLELSRTEAAGTPQEQTITTEWHPDYRLPVRITEPGRVTEYTYDAQGRQLSRKTSGVQ